MSEQAKTWLRQHPRSVMREPCDCCGIDENDVYDLLTGLLKPQPSLTPADLIALREEWRAKADKHREQEKLARLTEYDIGQASNLASRITYEQCADQLDTLITRLSSETDKEK